MVSFDVTDFLSFSVHGGADSGGVAGNVDNLLSAIERLVTLSPAQIFAELMPGIHALPNLHPMFVHFPIALLSLFFLIDLVGAISGRDDCGKCASWLLYLGTLFAAMTVAAGLQAATTIPHGDDVHEIMEQHEHLAISVLALALALSAWRLLAKNILRGPAKVLYLVMAGILVTVLAFTADLGGLMVYGHGVAVAPVMAANREAATAHEHGAAGGHEHHQPGVESMTDGAIPQETPASAPFSPEQSKPLPPSGEGPRIHTHADGRRHEHKH